MSNDLDLGALFALSDTIGDKYLTDAERVERDAELAKLEAEIAALSQ